MERLCHPITGLATGSLADEHLYELQTTSDWAVLSVGLEGLKAFAEAYGFVARDDVVRAVGLMLSHVVTESQDPNAFVGHMDDLDFFVVIAPNLVDQIQQALIVRLEEAMVFFYPQADWEAGQADPDLDLPRMSVNIGVLEAPANPFSNLEELKKAIIKTQRKSISA
jgi:GGDEF domain-containing protein